MNGDTGGEERGLAAPVATDRLFFAVVPDAHAVGQIGRLAQHLRVKYGLQGRPLVGERLHVTLYHVGDFAGLPQQVVDLACGAAEAVMTSSFDVLFDRVLSFGAKRRKYPLVLCGGDGVSELVAFQKALGSAMGRTGFTARGVNSSYTPHVTLLYDTQRVIQQPVEAIAWHVREFVLIRSLLGKSHHIALARWPLMA